MENICEGKPVSSSASQKTLRFSVLEYPFSATKLLEVIDTFAMQIAQTHAGSTCLPVGIDSLHFFLPFLEKDLLLAKASINRVWDSYMEIGVKVIAEDFRLLEEKDILSAYFTYRAVDREHKPVLVPAVIPHTEIEKKRYKAADLRRKLRAFSKPLKRRIFPHTSYLSNG